MLSSRVKISCFRAKADLVFHSCLYKKSQSAMLPDQANNLLVTFGTILYPYNHDRFINVVSICNSYSENYMAS